MGRDPGEIQCRKYSDRYKRLRQITRKTWDRSVELASERKTAYDAKLRGERHFEVGDLVMVLDKTGNRTKFDAQWRGPFRIVERRSTSFKIQHLRHLHQYPGLFNPDHLRLYYPRPERLTLDGTQLLEVEDIPPEMLRARRRTRVSRRPTQTPATTTTIVARPNITTTHPFPEPPVTAYPSVAQPTITLTDTAGRTVPSIVVVSPEAQATSKPATTERTDPGELNVSQMHTTRTHPDVAAISPTEDEATTVPTNEAPLEATSTTASRTSPVAGRTRIGLPTPPSLIARTTGIAIPPEADRVVRTNTVGGVVDGSAPGGVDTTETGGDITSDATTPVTPSTAKVPRGAISPSESSADTSRTARTATNAGVVQMDLAGSGQEATDA